MIYFYPPQTNRIQSQVRFNRIYNWLHRRNLYQMYNPTHLKLIRLGYVKQNLRKEFHYSYTNVIKK
jgi:hypothetical protein